MNLVESFLTKNPCWVNNINAKQLYDSGSDKRYWQFQQSGPKGLMLHSVGCAQPNAQVFLNGWNNANYTYSCVHGIIDANTGTVYQCLKWNYRGWHGGGSSNNTHVGVEMCESGYIAYDNPNDYSKFSIKDKAKAQADCARAYNAAVELFAMICKQYNLNPMKDIVSHYEGGKMGIASGHGDPEHYWKGLGMGYTMDGFRSDVKKAMEPPAPTFENPFTDVAKGKFYYEPVLWCAERGIVNGKTKDTFAPNDGATRGEIATMIYRLAAYLGKV